jgi:hypothetical protein
MYFLWVTEANEAEVSLNRAIRTCPISSNAPDGGSLASARSYKGSLLRVLAPPTTSAPNHGLYSPNKEIRLDSVCTERLRLPRGGKPGMEFSADWGLRPFLSIVNAARSNILPPLSKSVAVSVRYQMDCFTVKPARSGSREPNRKLVAWCSSSYTNGARANAHES